MLDSNVDFAMLFNNGPHACLLVDSDGNIVISNTAAEQLFGEHSRSLGVSDLLPASRYSGLMQKLRRLFQQQQQATASREWQTTMLDHGGREFPVAIDAVLLPTAASAEFPSQPYALLAVRDISRQTAREQQLGKDIDNSIALVHNISHDLKSPLRVIRNAANWLMEDLGSSLSGDNLDNLQLIVKRIARLEKLLNALEEYFRLGRRKDLRYREIISCQTLLDDMLDMLVAPSNFHITRRGDLEAIKLYRMPLESVLFKLLENPIQHSDGTEICLNFTAWTEPQYYCFQVSDNGPGIAPAFHQTIFDALQTLKSRDRNETSGMGLTIAAKILADYGGDISVGSALGQGSTFTVRWPKSASPGWEEPAGAQR